MSNTVLTHTAYNLTQVKQPSLATIIFYLQKNNHPDDILMVHRLHNGHYRAKFKNNTVGYDYITEIETYHDLVKYLDNFMMFAVCDRDGCSLVQIDMPGLPTILIRPYKKDWDLVYSHVRNYLYSVSKTTFNWPKEFRIS